MNDDDADEMQVGGDGDGNGDCMDTPDFANWDVPV